MYGDVTKIRRHRVSTYLSDEEMALFQALADYTGEERSVLLRQVTVDRALEILTAPDPISEAPEWGLKRA